MTPWLPDGACQWGGRPVARVVADTLPRHRAVLTGSVRSVTSRCDGVGARVEAVLDDGSGTIVLCFDGRSAVPGVAPGAVVTVEGTVAVVRGRRLLRNPLYRFSGSSGSSTSW